MTIRLIGLRKFFNSKKQKEDTKTINVKGGAKSIQEVLEFPERLLSSLPEEERYNIFFTVAHTLEGKGRRMESQNAIFYDIDDVDFANLDATIEAITTILKVDRSNIGIIKSGNGLHMFVEILQPFTSEKFFEDNRFYYKAICGRINQALFEKGISGSADPLVFAPTRMGRMPLTRNVKEGKPDTNVEIINSNIIPLNHNLRDLSGLPEVSPDDQISGKVFDGTITADTEGVLSGCEFIKWCKDNQELVNESQWYALLSILARLENGTDLCHQYSSEHPSYSDDETDNKIEQALHASGPRTCTNINSLWSGCKTCEHWGKCKSPITIIGEGFLRTKQTGFWNMSYGKDGNPKPTKPNYEDLKEHFNNVHPYITEESTGLTHIWKNGFWQLASSTYIRNFAYTAMDPKPASAHYREFELLLSSTNLVFGDIEPPEEMVNFANGVFNMSTGELEAHNQRYLFQYKLPYDYDEHAPCDRYTQFMEEVTLNNPDMIDLLEEYMGYCLSGICPSWGEKALLLLGSGANGKSVFLDILKFLAGKENYSTLTLSDMDHKEERMQLYGKLVNIAEETPRRGLSDSTNFKNLVTGGEVSVKLLYKQSFRIKNRAKLVTACNELPANSDTSTGLYRRLLIVPFDACFLGEAQDKLIRQKLLKEVSGIVNVAIQGYKRLRKNGYFTIPKETEMIINEYRTASNTVDQWTDENLNMEGDMDKDVSLEDLYQEFKFWSEQKGYRPLGYTEFGRRLRKALHPERFTRPKVEGRRLTRVAGVELLS